MCRQDESSLLSAAGYRNIGEGKSVRCMGSTSQSMDVVSDLGQNGKPGPVSPMEALARHETVKVVSTPC
jgi:hypothetical protein